MNIILLRGIPVLIFVNQVLLFVQGDDCTTDKIAVSVDQLKNSKTGANLPTTIKDGETYTVICKYSNTHVFTNEVRSQSAVNKDNIDRLDAGSSTQRGEIEITCSKGKLKPDIFTSVSRWCTVGCSPLPEDLHHYWRVVYPDDAASLTKTAAPITPNVNNYISVSCKTGYAPQLNQLGVSGTRCLSSGYQPPLSNLLKCAPGCVDVAVSNSKITSERSNIDGTAPYNIGAVVTVHCSNGYVLQGEHHITCTSEQQWSPQIPYCSRSSSLPLTTSPKIIQCLLTWSLISVLLW